MKKAYFFISIITLLLFVMGSTSCTKEYYFDSGTVDGDFNGTIMDYLESKPEYFDTLVRVIKIAGFEDALRNEKLTFFAPADSSFRSLMKETNFYLESNGRPAIHSITQISPEIWRKHLSKYIFKFERALNDFPQLDSSNINSFPGQMFQSYNGITMNVGVNYADIVIEGANGAPDSRIKYAGYRSIVISFLTNQFTPLDVGTWVPAFVASANIKPTNGYVHVLRYASHDFGFSYQDFARDVAYNNNN